MPPYVKSFGMVKRIRPSAGCPASCVHTALHSQGLTCQATLIPATAAVTLLVSLPGLGVSYLWAHEKHRVPCPALGCYRHFLKPAVLLTLCFAATKKEKWVHDHPGQVVLTAGQILWTAECERALGDAEVGPKRALKALLKKWVVYLNKLTVMTRSKLEPVERSKVGGC